MECGETSFSTDNYEVVMRVTSFITLPIDIFGLLIIYVKSDKMMKTYKWYLFTHQIMCTLNDVCWGLFVTPVLLAPSVSGYGVGVFSLVGVPTYYQLAAGLTGFGASLASVIALFYYRAQVVMPEHHLLHHKTSTRVACLLFMYVFCIGGYLLMLQAVAKNQEKAKTELVERWSCAPDQFWNNSTLILERGDVAFLNIRWFPLKSLLFTLAVFLLMMLQIVPLTRLLYSQRSKLSNSTRKQQWWFLRALILQIFVPYAVFLMSGLALTLRYQGLKPANYTFTFTCLWIQTLHGGLGTIAMVVFTRPYRNAFRLCYNRGTRVETLQKANASGKQPLSLLSGSVGTRTRSAQLRSKPPSH